MRLYDTRRLKLRREAPTVDTPLGPATVKLIFDGAALLRVAPEHAACAALAASQRATAGEVYRMVTADAARHLRTRPVMRRLALLLASNCGLGYAPVASGTFGTLAGLPAFWLLAGLSPAAYLLAWGVVTAVAVWAAGEAGRHYGVVDDGRIVIDELVRLPGHRRLPPLELDDGTARLFPGSGCSTSSSHRRPTGSTGTARTVSGWSSTTWPPGSTRPCALRATLWAMRGPDRRLRGEDCGPDHRRRTAQRRPRPTPTPPLSPSGSGNTPWRCTKRPAFATARRRSLPPLEPPGGQPPGGHRHRRARPDRRRPHRPRRRPAPRRAALPRPDGAAADPRTLPASGDNRCIRATRSRPCSRPAPPCWPTRAASRRAFTCATPGCRPVLPPRRPRRDARHAARTASCRAYWHETPPRPELP